MTISPLCKSTIDLTIAKPRPKPPDCEDREESIR